MARTAYVPDLVRERYSGARVAERLTSLYLSLAVDSAQPVR